MSLHMNGSSCRDVCVSSKGCAHEGVCVCVHVCTHMPEEMCIEE